MRLVIKDYLSQLKEKDELDFLICDLLLMSVYKELHADHETGAADNK